MTALQHSRARQRGELINRMVRARAASALEFYRRSER